MPWLVLIVCAVFEAVWATALGYSRGLTQPAPIVIFLVGLTISLGGLAYAMRTIPVGIAYSTWVGVGAALTVVVAMVSGVEPFSVWKLLFIAGIIGCVIGLKLIHEHPKATAPTHTNG